MERLRLIIGGLWCRLVGHAPRVEGDWPEDHVCPRCNDTEMHIGMSVHIVRPKREVPKS